MIENSSRLLLMWCNEGLECCINITKIDQKIMWETLKGGSQTCLPNLNAMILRARYNQQRHYEIYTVDVDSSITAKSMIEMFDENPQGMVDLIRERGYKLYSDRAERSKEKIV